MAHVCDHSTACVSAFDTMDEPASDATPLLDRSVRLFPGPIRDARPRVEKIVTACETGGEMVKEVLQRALVKGAAKFKQHTAQ